MSKREIYEQKTEEILNPIMEELEFELVDVEYVKEGSMWYLRAYIDKPGGITVNDCEAVSRRLSDILDEKDFIEDSYVLEVSSPGLGRPLKKEKDYKRNLGKEVEIRTYRMVGLLILTVLVWVQWPGILMVFGLSLPMFCTAWIVYSFGRLPGMDIHDRMEQSTGRARNQTS